MLIFFFPFEALRRHRWSSGSGDPAFPFALGRGLVRPLSVMREEGGRVVHDMVEDKDPIKRNFQTAKYKGSSPGHSQIYLAAMEKIATSRAGNGGFGQYVMWI